ncbi:hypothetical protein TNCV_1602561 [Trichonephila clavipes]|nr:hypothetical protein TNCV_1602561 [Trichonephila clavipes]
MLNAVSLWKGSKFRSVVIERALTIQITSNIARAKKVARFNETFPQAGLQRLEQAKREAAHIAAETPEQF